MFAKRNKGEDQGRKDQKCYVGSVYPFNPGVLNLKKVVTPNCKRKRTALLKGITVISMRKVLRYKES